jgi:hypothetical protein
MQNILQPGTMVRILKYPNVGRVGVINEYKEEQTLYDVSFIRLDPTDYKGYKFDGIFDFFLWDEIIPLDELPHNLKFTADVLQR